jgi:hypothetical protein
LGYPGSAVEGERGMKNEHHHQAEGTYELGCGRWRHHTRRAPFFMRPPSLRPHLCGLECIGRTNAPATSHFNHRDLSDGHDLRLYLYVDHQGEVGDRAYHGGLIVAKVVENEPPKCVTCQAIANPFIIMRWQWLETAEIHIEDGFVNILLPGCSLAIPEDEFWPAVMEAKKAAETKS